MAHRTRSGVPSALLARTLVVSGDAGGAATAHVVARWQCAILPKPFDAGELIDALQELERVD